MFAALGTLRPIGPPEVASRDWQPSTATRTWWRMPSSSWSAVLAKGGTYPALAGQAGLIDYRRIVLAGCWSMTQTRHHPLPLVCSPAETVGDMQLKSGLPPA